MDVCFSDDQEKYDLKNFDNPYLNGMSQEKFFELVKANAFNSADLLYLYSITGCLVQNYIESKDLTLCLNMFGLRVIANYEDVPYPSNSGLYVACKPFPPYIHHERMNELVMLTHSYGLEEDKDNFIIYTEEIDGKDKDSVEKILIPKVCSY